MAIALTVLESVGHVLLKMLISLASEDFIKKAVVVCLDKLVSKMDNPEAKTILSAAEEAWNKPSA